MEVIRSKQEEIIQTIQSRLSNLHYGVPPDVYTVVAWDYWTVYGSTNLSLNERKPKDEYTNEYIVGEDILISALEQVYGNSEHFWFGDVIAYKRNDSHVIDFMVLRCNK
jgi:hypothetical protein